MQIKYFILSSFGSLILQFSHEKRIKKVYQVLEVYSSLLESCCKTMFINIVFIFINRQTAQNQLSKIMSQHKLAFIYSLVFLFSFNHFNMLIAVYGNDTARTILPVLCTLTVLRHCRLSLYLVAFFLQGLSWKKSFECFFQKLLSANNPISFLMCMSYKFQL